MCIRCCAVLSCPAMPASQASAKQVCKYGLLPCPGLLIPCCCMPSTNPLQHKTHERILSWMPARMARTTTSGRLLMLSLKNSRPSVRGTCPGVVMTRGAKAGNNNIAQAAACSSHMRHKHHLATASWRRIASTPTICAPSSRLAPLSQQPLPAQTHRSGTPSSPAACAWCAAGLCLCWG